MCTFVCTSRRKNTALLKGILRENMISLSRGVRMLIIKAILITRWESGGNNVRFCMKHTGWRVGKYLSLLTPYIKASQVPARFIAGILKNNYMELSIKAKLIGQTPPSPSQRLPRVLSPPCALYRYLRSAPSVLNQ